MTTSNDGNGRPDPVGEAFRRVLDASRANRRAILEASPKPPSTIDPIEKLIAIVVQTVARVWPRRA